MQIYMVIANQSNKSPLSILIHLRSMNLISLRKRFDDCLFQVSLLHVQFLYLESLLSKFLHITFYNCC